MSASLLLAVSTDDGECVLSYRIRVLGGGLQLDFPGRSLEVPTASREVGALVVLSLNAGHELPPDTFKMALYDVDPAFVSNSAIQTPISRLRKAGLPIPVGRYVLEVEPSDVDIVDVAQRAGDFIDAVSNSTHLDQDEAVELVHDGNELHGLWQHDPAHAVGHDPVLSELFEPHRRRRRRFVMAFVRLLGAVGDSGRALETLAEYVDSNGDDAQSRAIRASLLEASATDLPALEVSRPAAATSSWSAASDDGSEWPAQIQVGLPPSLPRAFQQRGALAAKISSEVADGDSEDSEAPTQVVVAGGGGVGKTQLAASVFARARDEGVEFLVWVDASSRESIVTTYAQARAEIESTAMPGRSADEAAMAFLSWLGATTRSWLVVLDDVADPADVRGLWPEGRSGRVVATTRRRDLAPAAAKQVVVGVFEPDEASAYLEERLAGTPTQAAHPRVLDGMVELAEDLGRLPVAVAQAAAVILNEGITCAEYRRRFVDQASFDRLFPADAGADDYAHTVATTWSLAIDLADRLPPAGFARPALHIAAVVDPNGAPEALWLSPPVLRFLDRKVNGDSDTGRVTEDQARAALRNLHRLSLLKHDPAGGPLAVHTHSLVQRATLEPLTVEQRAEIVRVAADALAVIWPSTENNPGRARVLRHNTATLAGRVADVLWQPDAHELLFRAGRSLGELGLAHDAITHWTEMQAAATRLLGPDHPQTLTIRHDLADAQAAAGDLVGAAKAFDGLIRDCQRVLGPDHPHTLTARNDVADWRGASGEIEVAVRMLGDLLADRLQLLGPDHPDTLTTRHDLAYWLGATGDVAAAVAGFEELVDDRSRILGADHPDTFVTRRRLAYWRGMTGDAASAVVLLEALLDDQLDVLGRDHPDMLSTLHGLAYWRGLAGDASGAAQGFEKLLADRTRILGPGHFHTLAARQDLADWTGIAGDAAGAVEMLVELLGDEQGALGPDHPHTFTTRHDLAYWRGVTADAEGAARGFEELLADRSRVLGPDHPHTLAARRDLAYWRRLLGNGPDRIEDDMADGSDGAHSHPPGVLPLCDWRCGGRGQRLRRTARRSFESARPGPAGRSRPSGVRSR